MKLSIIVPCYNEGAVLEHAIKSVLTIELSSDTLFIKSSDINIVLSGTSPPKTSEFVIPVNNVFDIFIVYSIGELPLLIKAKPVEKPKPVGTLFK